MSLRIEIELKNKHSITIREDGDLQLLVEAADEIRQAIENVISQYMAVYDKLGNRKHGSDH